MTWPTRFELPSNKTDSMGPKTDIPFSISVRAVVSARSSGTALARTYLKITPTMAKTSKFSFRILEVIV